MNSFRVQVSKKLGVKPFSKVSNTYYDLRSGINFARNNIYTALFYGRDLLPARPRNNLCTHLFHAFLSSTITPSYLAAHRFNNHLWVFAQKPLRTDLWKIHRFTTGNVYCSGHIQHLIAARFSGHSAIVTVAF